MTRAAVIGSGPNGLAAALVLARAGVEVTVYEAMPQLGGAARTLDGPAPGHVLDWGAAVHPMALVSPFFREYGLTDAFDLIVPDASYAHPLPDGRAGIAWRDLDRTVDELGEDGRAWRRLMRPLAAHMAELGDEVLDSLWKLPRHPLLLAQFGRRVLATTHPRPFAGVRGEVALAMLAGVFAHSVAPITSIGASAAGLVLAVAAHAGGWPIPVGGTGRLIDVLIDALRAAGVRFVTDTRVDSLRDIAPADIYLLDTTASAAATIAGEAMRPGYARAARRVRPGNAVAKVDFALAGPIPWRDPRVHAAATVHLGGTREQIARAELDVARGRHPDEPYVLLAQPSIADSTRAPEGRTTVWAYTHVPAGSTRDMAEAISAAIEAAAPGFRDLVLARRSVSAAELGAENLTMPRGDFASGAITLRQLLARPVAGSAPWRAGEKVYLCSAATAPGPGVHGMAGYRAALSALRDRGIPSRAR